MIDIFRLLKQHILLFIQICSAIAVGNQAMLQETVKELKMVSICLYTYAAYNIMFIHGDTEAVEVSQIKGKL